MPQTSSLRDAYRYPGFLPAFRVHRQDEEPYGFIVPLHRRRKKVCAVVACVPFVLATMPHGDNRVILIAEVCPSTWSLLTVACSAHGVV